MEFRGFQSRNFDVHGKNDYSSFRESISMQFKSPQPPQIILHVSLILEEICREMTILQQAEVSYIYAIFSVNRYAYCVWLLHTYEAHMKGLPICFSEVQVKNDVTDNNNKHFVTAF